MREKKGRAWFRSSLDGLVASSTGSVVGSLAAEAARLRLDPNPETISAWETTIDVLQSVAKELPEELHQRCTVLLEFQLPRRRRRIDVVLLAHDLILLIEVKAGAERFDRASSWQAEQYALDLRDFHAGSAGHTIIPILLATNAPNHQRITLDEPSQSVSRVQLLTAKRLARALSTLIERFHDPAAQSIDPASWEDSPYRPTPSIVEAACDLYEGHDVADIKHQESHNLDLTVDAVVQLVNTCRASRRRAIAFITGAPGSGKTLAGLQVVHDPRIASSAETAGVFISGNMPLVEVIASALSASSAQLIAERREEMVRRVSTFVQHAYAFRDEYAEHEERTPHEHVILFDEAQRAWDSAQVSRWTRGRSTRSEPRLILDIMSRMPGWSVVIAMVGSGQEINRGEAGLAEWGRALLEHHPDWRVLASPIVLPGSPNPPPGGLLFDLPPENGPEVMPEERLHLEMNVRSPRAEKLNTFVDALLDLDLARAQQAVPSSEFPLALTRSFVSMKQWLHDHGSEDQRYGLVASADARRLRAWGLDTRLLRQDKAWPDWFLRNPGDVRSSFQLEVPATNFDCQGLELDWVGVCWGNDFTYDAESGAWRTRVFRGTRWTNAAGRRAMYLLNGYRVVLTRARRGQILWIPRSDGSDHTLEPSFLDETADYLIAAGVPSID